MLQPISEDEALKINALEIARHHRRTCDGPSCTISLHQLYQLLKRAGIELTEDERQLFL